MTVMTAPTSSDVPRRAPRPAATSRPTRLLAGGAGLLAAAGLVAGVLLPWISTFEGMLSQSAWGTRNGDIMLGLAAVCALAAVAQALRPAVVPVRWALALAGLASAGFGGYLYIQLSKVVASQDGMVFARQGPGLFVCMGAGLLAFATIFLPTPAPAGVDDTRAGGGVRSGPTDQLRVLRPVAAGLAVVAGLAHVPVTPAHLEEAPYIGVLFIALTLVMVLGATALVVTDHTLVYAGLGVAAALAVAAYVVSRTVGLPLMSDDIGHWAEPLGVVSIVSESLLAIVSSVVLVRRRRHRAAR